MSSRNPSPRENEDPLLRSARREALVTAVLASVALVYTIGYAALFGYGRSGESLTFILGMPDWVFASIVAPWLVCVGLSWWFSSWFIEDDTLEHAEPAPIDGNSRATDGANGRDRGETP
jgi:hypothetical protein